MQHSYFNMYMLKQESLIWKSACVRVFYLSKHFTLSRIKRLIKLFLQKSLPWFSLQKQFLLVCRSNFLRAWTPFSLILSRCCIAWANIPQHFIFKLLFRIFHMPWVEFSAATEISSVPLAGISMHGYTKNFQTMQPGE